MPKMQVDLPDELHAAVNATRLGASKLLQDAVRAERRRRTLVEEVRLLARRGSAVDAVVVRAV